MNITWNPKAGQISPMRTASFAAPKEEAASAVEKQPQDQMEISQAGQQAAAKAEGGTGFDQMAAQLEANLRSMTKADFQSMVRAQLGEQQLEVNWNAAVDPDGSVWATHYVQSLGTQCAEAKSAIESYYADAYKEALDSPLGSTLPNQLNFLAGKYLCSWSDYFDGSMPADERQWTYSQVRAMLTGTGVKLNDPFALAAGGLDTKNMDKIARQAATDQIGALIRQAKAEAGIEE